MLIANALISSAFTAIPAFYSEATPVLVITALFLIGGLSRSLQFTSINTLSYADVPPDKLSRATSFAAVGQELSGSVGVTVAALGLEVMQRMNGGGQIDIAPEPAGHTGFFLWGSVPAPYTMYRGIRARFRQVVKLMSSIALDDDIAATIERPDLHDWIDGRGHVD